MPSWLNRLLNMLFGPLAIPTPTPTPRPPSAMGFVDAINMERQNRNLPPLIENLKLSDTAQTWASYLAQTNILSHGSFMNRIATVFPNTMAGEDIAEGQLTVTQVVADWMSSPGHRANILGDYNRIGWGFAESSTGHTFWVVDFILVPGV